MGKSAEELKADVRKYADENAPGWEVASVSIRVGKLEDGLSETLLVLPLSAPPPPPGGPAGREGTPG